MAAKKNELLSGKKFINELLDPKLALEQAMESSNLKKPKSEVIEKEKARLLTDDGREMFNENC